MDRKNPTHIRDVAMNGIGAFLGSELSYEKTEYFEGASGAIARFETTDGQRWRVTVERLPEKGIR